MTFVIRTKQSNVFNRYVPKNKKHDKKWIRMILGHVSNLCLCAYIANIILGRWVMGLFWSEPAWSSCSSLAFFASGALIFFLFLSFFQIGIFVRRLTENQPCRHIFEISTSMSHPLNESFDESFAWVKQRELD